MDSFVLLRDKEGEVLLNVDLTCKSCGARNEMTFGKTLERQKVACSNCGAELGALCNLVAIEPDPEA